jgi:hypothetical protein
VQKFNTFTGIYRPTNGIDNVAVAVQRQSVIYTETIEFAEF